MSVFPLTRAREIMDNYYKSVNQKLLQALPTAARVLEVGCAEGRLGHVFKQQCPQAEWIGVDIHAPAVEAAKQLLDEAHCLNVAVSYTHLTLPTIYSV